MGMFSKKAIKEAALKSTEEQVRILKEAGYKFKFPKKKRKSKNR